jgi:hypothetical protein
MARQPKCLSGMGVAGQALTPLFGLATQAALHRPVRLVVRTPAFHVGNTGSSPVRDAIDLADAVIVTTSPAHGSVLQANPALAAWRAAGW